MACVLESLQKIQCDCERADFLRDAISTRDGLINALERIGFGRPGSAVPTDWRVYFHVDELREFILSYAEPAMHPRLSHAT